MSNKTCKDCLHCSIENKNEVYCSDMPWHYPFGGSDTTTLDKKVCEHFVERDKPTIFDHITQSYEMLAEKLVYEESLIKPDGTYVCRYFSTIIDGGCWLDEEEAISATIAKLKGVYNG